MLGASVPLISRKSYLSSNKKSLKTRAMVSPGSARIDHVQSRLLSYSAGYPGLVIEPAVPRNVPPHAPSARDIQKKKKMRGKCKPQTTLPVCSALTVTFFILLLSSPDLIYFSHLRKSLVVLFTSSVISKIH